MTTVRHVSTEAGLRLLQGTLRNFQLGGRLASAIHGRVHHTSLGTSDPRELTAQSAFLRLVSITEATVDSLGVELTHHRVRNIDETVRLLMLEKELAATSTWEARRRAFRRHHGVDLRKCTEFPRVEGAVEVRNAIAHGLGRLTTRQVQSGETQKLLARVGVSVVNDFVELRPDHLKECTGYASTFLWALDSAV